MEARRTAGHAPTAGGIFYFSARPIGSPPASQTAEVLAGRGSPSMRLRSTSRGSNLEGSPLGPLPLRLSYPNRYARGRPTESPLTWTSKIYSHSVSYICPCACTSSLPKAIRKIISEGPNPHGFCFCVLLDGVCNKLASLTLFTVLRAPEEKRVCTTKAGQPFFAERRSGTP